MVGKDMDQDAHQDGLKPFWLERSPRKLCQDQSLKLSPHPLIVMVHSQLQKKHLLTCAWRLVIHQTQK